MKLIIILLSFSLFGCAENIDIQELLDKDNNISKLSGKVEAFQLVKSEYILGDKLKLKFKGSLIAGVDYYKGEKRQVSKIFFFTTEGKIIALYTDMVGINEAEYNDLKMKPDGYIEENNIETYRYELDDRISSIKGKYTGLNFRDLNDDRFMKEAQGIIKMSNIKIFNIGISGYDFQVIYNDRELI